MNLYRYLNLSLLAFTGVLMLISLFIVNLMPIDTLLIDKIIWLEWSTLAFAVAVFLVEISMHKKGFVFCLADILLLAYTGLEFYFYDSSSNFNQFNIVFSGQLLMMWFLMRTALQYYPELKVFYIFVMVCVSVIIVLMVAIQNVNTDSLHFRSPIVFYRNRNFQLNEMLYVFVSVLIPLSVDGVLRFIKTDKLHVTRPSTFFLYFYAATLLFFVCMLLESDNRIAMISAATGTLLVIGVRLRQQKLPHKINRWLTVVYVIAIAGFCLFTYDSINKMLDTQRGKEQLLTWKITKNIIIDDNPFEGHGFGTFPIRYAHEQSRYLRSPEASREDALYASSPYQCGSGYMQSVFEIGLLGCFVFMAWIIVSAIDGIKNRTIGLSGLIISVAVLFLFLSPMQYPLLWVVLFVGSAMAVTETNQNYKGRNYKMPFVGLLVAIVVFMSFYFEYEYVDKYRRWFDARKFVENKNYKMAARQFTSLYQDLSYEPLFLKDGLQALKGAGVLNEPNIWYRRAIRLSASPTIYYSAADYRISNKEYARAEYALCRIKGILPARPETYLKLMKLYSLPEYRDVIKFKITYKELEGLKNLEGFSIPYYMQKEIEDLNKNIVVPK